MPAVNSKDGNILADFNELKCLLDKHLQICTTCRIERLEVENVCMSNITNSIRLVCKRCAIDNGKARDQRRYLTNLVPTLYGPERYKKKRKLTNLLKDFIETISPTLSSRQLVLQQITYATEQKGNRIAMKYDLNTCLYMAPFFTGSGFDTCLGTLASLNIEGTVGTKRSFYRHQQNIASNIRNITSSVIYEAKEA